MLNDFSQKIIIDKHLTLENRVIDAPMAGVMNPVFCRAVNKMNLFKNWFTPFISITGGSLPSYSKLKAKIKHFQNEYDIIVQLLGHDPETLAATAKRLVEIGVNGINLNFACPAPLVMKNGNGGILLQNISQLFAVADSVAQTVGNSANISVKIRVGFDSDSELYKITETILRTGIRTFICHFRTVKEMYDTPKTPLKRLAELRRILPQNVILIGNGDVASVDDAFRLCNETGCDGVAVGRAILTDPFLLQKIANNDSKPASDEQRIAFLRAIIESARELNCFTQKWLLKSFVGYARMSFSSHSPIFEKIVANPALWVKKIETGNVF